MITIRASQSDRAFNCSGSVGMEQSVPTPPKSDDAQEGIAAHEAAALVLSGKVGSLAELVDRQMLNGVIVTEDMVTHTQVYVDHVQSRGLTNNVEYAVSHPLIEGQIGIEGVIDNWSMDDEQHILYVDDFKYGYRSVEVMNNWQLFCGALGLGALKVRVDHIALTITQPRPYHPLGAIRTEWITQEELQFRFDTAAFKAHSVLHDPCTQTGPHCLHCNAFQSCPAAQAAGMNSVDVAGQAVLSDLPDAALAAELFTLRRAKTMLDNRITALDDMAMSRIKAGADVPGWTLDKSFGKNRWKKDIDVVILEALAGDSCIEKKIITPAAAKRAGVPEEMINAFTERPYTGVKLVPIDVDTQAKEMFK